ncbi:MBL fold metallo-hydrolase [Micromonospora sp. NPDC048898]|uniref:MBL fold metallo-hydrolase n=1 Tax=Micromonospora sp. NPDC048898 TaxID=3364260 RepID=UPI00371A985D
MKVLSSQSAVAHATHGSRPDGPAAEAAAVPLCAEPAPAAMPVARARTATSSCRPPRRRRLADVLRGERLNLRRSRSTEASDCVSVHRRWDRPADRGPDVHEDNTDARRASDTHRGTGGPHRGGRLADPHGSDVRPAGSPARVRLGTSSRKVTGPALRPEQVGPIDAVLLSHAHHADNLDESGRELLADVPVIVTTRAGARRLGGRARGLRPWDETVLDASGRPPITVTATPCRHGPPLSLPIAGPVIGFALRWDGQEHGVLWVTGDTVMFRGLREVPRRLTVGTVLLHLGAVRFPMTGRLHYSLTGREAVELCRLVRPHTIIPVHYEGWSHFSQGRAAVERAFAAAPDGLGDRLRWLPRQPQSTH